MERRWKIYTGEPAGAWPGLIAATVLSLAVPVAIQEKVDVMAALRRSASLTEGYRWTVFGVLFVIGIINGGVGMVIGLLFGFSGHPEKAHLVGQIVGVLVGGLAARDIASVFD